MYTTKIGCRKERGVYFVMNLLYFFDSFGNSSGKKLTFGE